MIRGTRGHSQQMVLNLLSREPMTFNRLVEEMLLAGNGKWSLWQTLKVMLDEELIVLHDGKYSIKVRDRGYRWELK